MSAFVLESLAYLHLVSTELGPFYDGAAHPLLTPEDLLLLVVLAILGAFGGRAPARRQFLGLTIGWAGGLVAGSTLSMSLPSSPIVGASVLLALGALGMARVRVEQALLVPVAAGLGFLRGVANAAELDDSGGSLLASVGIATGIAVLSCLLSALAVAVEERRATIALRVAASWIVAIALLMLGWELRPST